MNNWNDGSEKYNLEHKLRVAEGERDAAIAELKELRAVNDRHVDRLNSLLLERNAAIQERDRLRAMLEGLVHRVSGSTEKEWLEGTISTNDWRWLIGLGTANETHAAQSGATESVKE